MKVGLTLGKFAPLHQGHQLVISTALRETDHVIVLIYPAAETSIPLAVRAEWIRTLYPTVEVIEAMDAPTAVGYSPEIMAMHDEDISSRMRGRGVTHFFSSEPYGAHVSTALGAIDRRVDEARVIAPVSGSAVRSDPYAHRRFIDPIVYQSLITRVAFVGAPSTGKTTLASRLAERYSTTWMPEYGREYWEKHHVNRRLPIEDLVTIAEEHRRIEDGLALKANRFLFVDTEAIITRVFSLYYHGRALPRLEQLADESPQHYQFFFLCDTDIPFDDTPDRSGEVVQRLFQKTIQEELCRRGVPFVTLQGSVEERIQAVGRVIQGQWSM